MFFRTFIRRLALLLLVAGITSIWGQIHVQGSTKSVQEQSTKHWVWPVKGEITDTFGTRHGNHKGLDIAATRGDKILSVDKGYVERSYYSDTYGHVVFIKHPNGLETVYAHMSKRTVEEGAVVEIGEKIGEVGSTGVSTGNHLHFEVHKGEWNYEKNNAVDPLVVFQQTNNEQDHKMALSEETEESVAVSKHDSTQEKSIRIKVNKNDTLWALSIEHQVPVESIMNWNRLDSSLILEGQVLKIYPSGSRG